MIRDVAIALGGIALFIFLFFVVAPMLPENSAPESRDPACSPGMQNCSLGADGNELERPFTPRAPGKPVEMQPIACPADAKICPDGTALGREGPNCEFPACPGE